LATDWQSEEVFWHIGANAEEHGEVDAMSSSAAIAPRALSTDAAGDMCGPDLSGGGGGGGGATQTCVGFRPSLRLPRLLTYGRDLLTRQATAVGSLPDHKYVPAMGWIISQFGEEKGGRKRNQ